LINRQGKIKVFSALIGIVNIFVVISVSNAQELKNNLAVFEGQILTNDSLLPIPNAHVISKFNSWGTISNKEGKFAMYVSPYDSVLFTSIGFAPKIIYINDSVMNNLRNYDVVMVKDTFLINEVVIQAFWDYETFKYLITSMEPLDLDSFYPEWTGTGLLYRSGEPAPIGGPIQALYNVFNRNARLQRKLIKNRKNYNQIMIMMGRPQDTIPAIPEHMQE
jgi:hypothetical protein